MRKPWKSSRDINQNNLWSLSKSNLHASAHAKRIKHSVFRPGIVRRLRSIFEELHSSARNLNIIFCSLLHLCVFRFRSARRTSAIIKIRGFHFSFIDLYFHFHFNFLSICASRRARVDVFFCLCPIRMHFCDSKHTGFERTNNNVLDDVQSKETNRPN